MTNDPFKNLRAAGAFEEMMRKQRQLDEILKPSATLRALEQVERMTAAAKMFEHLDLHSKLLAFTQTPAYLKALDANATISKLTAAGRFALPDLAVHRVTEIARLSELAAARVPSFDKLIGASTWAATLADRMSAIDTDWAVVDAEAESAEAFARLSRLSDITRIGAIYTDETTEALVDELGDPIAPFDDEAADSAEAREARYDDAGRDRQLIAFPPPAYGKILVSAGHLARFPAPPEIVVEDGLIEAVQFSPETGFLLQSLEGHLRQLVVARLQAAEGEAWFKRRVPHGLRLKWAEGREAAKAAGKPVFAPIQYANFMDLADVITAGNNWADFQAIFTSRDNLRVGLLRLYGIRNDIAHARPISMTDQLIAVAEGAMLFRAMGLLVSFGA